MHHEFALDPECINDWAAFKYVVDQCGFEHGRLISRFPGKWERVALTACKIQGVKRTTIVEKTIRRMKEKFVVANRDYDAGGSPWLANAMRQNEKRPFHAIIALANPKNHEVVLIADEIEETTPLWCIQRERIVPRKAKDLACCARKLLNVSEEIVLVDRNFKPDMRRFSETLSWIVNYAVENKHKPKRLELHVEYKETPTEVSPPVDIWQERCRRHLTRCLPENVQLEILRWQGIGDGDKPHARYILTERGGLRFDYGLDEWEGEGQTTDVSILGHTVYEKRWRDYQKETAAFRLIDTIFVNGV
jgi:hypothetical protein